MRGSAFVRHLGTNRAYYTVYEPRRRPASNVCLSHKPLRRSHRGISHISIGHFTQSAPPFTNTPTLQELLYDLNTTLSIPFLPDILNTFSFVECCKIHMLQRFPILKGDFSPQIRIFHSSQYSFKHLNVQHTGVSHRRLRISCNSRQQSLP